MGVAGLLLASLFLPTNAGAQTPAFSPFPLATGGQRAQLGALAAGPGGERFLATWVADGALHARLLARDGTPAGPDVTLATSPSPVRSEAVYNSLSGEFFVVWQGGGSLAHVVGMRIGGDGAPRGGTIVVSSALSTQGPPSLAVDGAGRLLAVWDDNANAAATAWDIVGLLMEPDGTVVGGDLLITYHFGRQLAPRVACDPARGLYLVVWEDERELYGAGTDRLILARALDLEGDPIGEEILLARTAAEYAGIAVAAEPGTGEFLVAWSDRGEEGSPTSPDLSLRRVRAEAGTAGPVTVLPAPGEPSRPALCFDASSRRWLLAWTDRREFAGAESLALARVLDASGQPLGDEFDLAPEAHGPALAAVEGHRVLTGWTDIGRGGLYAARLDLLAPPAPEPRVRDDRAFTAAVDRLGAHWSVVGFSGGLREFRTAVGTAPGRDDVAPWTAAPRPAFGGYPAAEPIVSGTRDRLRLEEGRSYYFSVVAVGSNGRQSRVGTSPGAIVDRTGPEVTITAAPVASPRGDAVVGFRGRDNLAPEDALRYRWRLDAGPWSLPSPGRAVRLEGLTPGSHRFEVQAIDPADNVGAATEARFAIE
jgi:hypothetical protein